MKPDTLNIPPMPVSLHEKYRAGRRRFAMQQSMPTLLFLAVLAVVLHWGGLERQENPVFMFAWCGFLWISTLFAYYWRTSLGHGARMGVFWGVLPLLFPLVLMKYLHHHMGAYCEQICMGTSLSTSFLLFLGIGASQPFFVPTALKGAQNIMYVAGAIVLAALTSGLGCQFMSAGSILGVFLGAVLGAIPAYGMYRWRTA